MTEHENKIAAEPDLPPKVSRHIWIYLVLMGGFLFLTIGSLTIYFRFAVDREYSAKVGKVDSNELIEKRSFEKSILSGDKGLFASKKNVSIEVAMEKFLQMQRNSGE
jgi:hypothetical protein